MIADVVVDLQYGDCGKGKIAHALCKENEYTHVIRYNGGCNAGHTIFHHGKKFLTSNERQCFSVTSITCHETKVFRDF